MGSIETATPAPELNFEKFYNVVAKDLRGSDKIHHGVNPSDRSLLWDVPIATERDLDEAVEIAREAFKSWSKTSWAERQQVMARMRDELQKYVPEMAKLLSLETGKPVSWIMYCGARVMLNGVLDTICNWRSHGVCWYSGLSWSVRRESRTSTRMLIHSSHGPGTRGGNSSR